MQPTDVWLLHIGRIPARPVRRRLRLRHVGRMFLSAWLDHHPPDLKVSASAVPTVEGKTVAGGAEIRRLAFDGTVAGPLAGPRIAGSLQAEDARLPVGRLAKLDATFSAIPSGPFSEPATFSMNCSR